MPVTSVIFDVGHVLYDWDPRILYERLFDDEQALDAFLRDVATREWHFQHDAGRPFAETSAELIARCARGKHAALTYEPSVLPDGTLAPREVVARVGIGTRVRMIFKDIGAGIALPLWTVDEAAAQPANPWRYPVE